MNGSTTPARNSRRRSSVKCGRPSPWASARAWETALAEQHEPSASFSSSAHSSSVTAIVGGAPAPGDADSWAATVESTPLLIATRVAPGTRGSAAPRRIAPPSARASASAASSAACSLPGLRPPSSAATCDGPIRAASTIDMPRTRSTAALPAAWAEPQPWAL